MASSDDDFIDVAATVAGGGDGDAALSAGGLDLGRSSSTGAAALLRRSPSPSTSEQQRDRRRPSPSASAPTPHSRRGWFSSIFGGGGALPAAVQAARSKTVREMERRRERKGEAEREKERGDALEKKPWKKTSSSLSLPNQKKKLSPFSFSLSPSSSLFPQVFDHPDLS